MANVYLYLVGSAVILLFVYVDYKRVDGRPAKYYSESSEERYLMGYHDKVDVPVICKVCGKSIRDYKVELINNRPYFICKGHNHVVRL